VQELIGLAVKSAFEWTFMDRCGEGFIELTGNRGFADCQTARFAAMPCSNAQDDSEDPRAQAGATFELGQSSVNDEKDILRCIFQGRLGDAETTQVSPDESSAAFIHLRKGGRGRRPRL
jgi:hypothetical protein